MPKVAAKEKIRRFLREHVGEVVTAHQLQEAAGNVTEWARRVRELRGDEGWKIFSHNDDASLKPGEYRLAELPPQVRRTVFSRSVSGRVRSQVLERNGYTCQMCGAAAGDTDDRGRHVRLHIGHIQDRSHGGRDDLSNLRALCSSCNEGAKNIVQEPPSWTWLLSQIRRARRDDQIAALNWLKKKLE